MTYLELEELDYFHLTDGKGSRAALTGSDILTGKGVRNALDEHLAKIKEIVSE